jgi:hypothetical protein
VSGETYDRLRAHAAANGTTGSGVVEDLLRGFFEMPDRDQKEVVAPIPRYERKPSIPKIAMKTDMDGRPIREVVIVTPTLEKEAAWIEQGPADRVQVIKDAHEAKTAFGKRDGDEVKKKEGVLPGDQAAKIFTF